MCVEENCAQQQHGRHRSLPTAYRETGDPIEWAPEAFPSDRELLGRAVNRLVTNPVKATRLGLNVVRNVAESAGLTNVSGVATRSRELVAALMRPSAAFNAALSRLS